jgi:hypothetical protein
LIHESHESTSLVVKEDVLVKDSSWKPESGLDNLILSISGNEKEETLEVETVFNKPFPLVNITSQTPVEVQPEPVKYTYVVPTPTPTNVKIGTLSVANANINTTNETPSAISTPFIPPPSFNLSKKTALKKGMKGARKIVSNTSTDNRMESFESVERRTTKSVQENEDRKVAIQLQNQEITSGNSSSRISAAYQDSLASAVPAPASIYRSNVPPAQSSGSYGSNANTSRRYNNVSTIPGADPTITKKYASNKGISSDQFFGRDEEDLALMKGRLGKFGSASAIGSKLFHLLLY